jgi:hypothetical protein
MKDRRKERKIRKRSALREKMTKEKDHYKRRTEGDFSEGVEDEK